MRSRYSAYALSEVDYLVRTHEPAHPPARDEIARWARSARFTGLEITSVERGGPEDSTGIVEFIARYEEDRAPRIHHERSLFRRIDGRWYYVDQPSEGPAGPAAQRRGSGPGRNDPCPCGSGKKFKKCCG